MAASPLVANIAALLDDAKCFEVVRQHRWPDGVRCTKCHSKNVIRNGHDDAQPHRQRYCCKACKFRFDDLTDTVFGRRHQPLRVWVMCLYLMGLNLSNRQIAQELDLCTSDVHHMTQQLREGTVDNSPPVMVEGEVEADEVYVVAGHKGQPDEVQKRGGRHAAAGSRGHAGAAPSTKTSPLFSV